MILDSLFVMANLPAMAIGLQATPEPTGGAAAQGSDVATGAETPVFVEESFRFLNLPELWVLGLVIVPAVILFAWWSYGGLSRLEPGTRVALSVLRGLAIAVLLIALFEPAWEQTRYTSVQSQVHVLVDDSASMQRRDTYPDAEQRDALARLSGGDIANRSRTELLRDVLGKPDGLLDVLGRKNDVRLFRFWREPRPIRNLGELTARGPRTQVGDALDLLRTSTAAGANLDALVLVSDGRSNGGLDAVEVAGRYRLDDVPIYTIGVGDPNPPRNARIVGPPGPQEALRKEEVAFDVTVSAEGMEGRSATVTLEASRDGGGFAPVTAPQTVLLGKDGAPVKVRIYHAFEDAGDYSLRFGVTPFPDETSTEDNVATRFLRVNDEKIRVLYLEESARWLYRYLHNALGRVDPSIEFQAYLFDASKDFPQERSEQLRSLERLPRTQEELRRYHVILLSDVAVEQLGATEEQRTAWLEQLVEFVEFGGGVGFLWGERAMPERYRGTPVEDLLPVLLEDQLILQKNPPDWTSGFRPVLMSPGSPHPIAMLRRDPEQNARLWREGFDEMNAYYPVRQAKAGAEVILQHPTLENRYGNLPLLVASSYPRGRTMFLGIDELWRMRKPYGDRYHDTLWRNIVRDLASGRLRRRNDLVELRVDKVIVDTGDRIEVSVQLLDDEFQLASSLQDGFPVWFRRPDGSPPQRRNLRPSGTGLDFGAFSGSFTLDDPGSISIMVTAGGVPDGELLAREDVLVKVPDREMAQSSQDRAALEAIAKGSKGGRYLFLADVEDLYEEFARRKPYEREVDRSTRPLWDDWWTILVVIGILAIEWTWRKRARLV